MKKINVCIEEHLCKKVEIECPDSMTDDEAMEYAYEKVKMDYKDKKVELTKEDYSGITLMMAESQETGFATSWNEIH